MTQLSRRFFNPVKIESHKHKHKNQSSPARVFRSCEDTAAFSTSIHGCDICVCPQSARLIVLNHSTPLRPEMASLEAFSRSHLEHHIICIQLKPTALRSHSQPPHTDYLSQSAPSKQLSELQNHPLKVVQKCQYSCKWSDMDLCDMVCDQALSINVKHFERDDDVPGGGLFVLGSARRSSGTQPPSAINILYVPQDDISRGRFNPPLVLRTFAHPFQRITNEKLTDSSYRTN